MIVIAAMVSSLVMMMSRTWFARWWFRVDMKKMMMLSLMLFLIMMSLVMMMYWLCPWWYCSWCSWWFRPRRKRTTGLTWRTANSAQPTISPVFTGGKADSLILMIWWPYFEMFKETHNLTLIASKTGKIPTSRLETLLQKRSGTNQAQPLCPW